MITASLPIELHEAEGLFIKFKKNLPALEDQDICNFRRAHELVKEFLRNNGDSNYAQYAERLRGIYTRRLLEEIPNMHLLTEEHWLSISLELFSMRDDLEPLFEQKPTLRQTYDDFRTQYPEYRRHLYDWLLEGIDDPEIRRKVTVFLLLEEENVV